MARTPQQRATQQESDASPKWRKPRVVHSGSAVHRTIREQTAQLERQKAARASAASEVVDNTTEDIRNDGGLSDQIAEFVSVCTRTFNGMSAKYAERLFHRLNSDEVPLIAPELYAEREKRAETAEEFVFRVYGSWLNGNGLFQYSLRKLDPQAMMALQNAFRGRREDLVQLLPPKEEDMNRRLQKSLGHIPPVGAKRTAALDTLGRGQIPGRHPGRRPKG